MAIHEVLAVTDEVRDFISNRAAEHVIKKAAVRAGMRTLLEDGIDKAARGLTTLEEVLRAVSRAEPAERAPDIPAVEAPAASVPESPPSPAPVASVTLAEPTSPAPERQRGPILVVEDSATIGTVLKYFLELEGFAVVLASDGRAGLEMALRDRPELIVSDVMMPGMGGVEMVKALRADARTSRVPILMLTSESSVESETEGLAAGADDYILKPVEPRRLAARVKALLARSRYTAA